MDEITKQQLTTFITSTISTDTTTANQVIKQYIEDKSKKIAADLFKEIKN